MKIRFWHRWIYWLYYRAWTPIYRTKPHLLDAQIYWMNEFLDQERLKKGDK